MACDGASVPGDPSFERRPAPCTLARSAGPRFATGASTWTDLEQRRHRARRRRL